MTKSAIATPGFTDGAVSTVKIEGSWEVTQLCKYVFQIVL